MGEARCQVCEGDAPEIRGRSAGGSRLLALLEQHPRVDRAVRHVVNALEHLSGDAVRVKGAVAEGNGKEQSGSRGL